MHTFSVFIEDISIAVCSCIASGSGRGSRSVVTPIKKCCHFFAASKLKMFGISLDKVAHVKNTGSRRL